MAPRSICPLVAVSRITGQGIIVYILCDVTIPNVPGKFIHLHRSVCPPVDPQIPCLVMVTAAAAPSDLKVIFDAFRQRERDVCFGPKLIYLGATP